MIGLDGTWRRIDRHIKIIFLSPGTEQLDLLAIVSLTFLYKAFCGLPVNF